MNFKVSRTAVSFPVGVPLESASCIICNVRYSVWLREYFRMGLCWDHHLLEAASPHCCLELCSVSLCPCSLSAPDRWLPASPSSPVKTLPPQPSPQAGQHQHKGEKQALLSPASITTPSQPPGELEGRSPIHLRPEETPRVVLSVLWP